MESVLKKELARLDVEIDEVSDGRIIYSGTEEVIARANIFLRTTERVMILAGRFRAVTFEELFENTRSIPWERYIPENARFWVTKATSVKSRLFSTSDIQSIMKKAMVERLKKVYATEWFKEDGNDYPIRVSIIKDEVFVGIDTSGESLHKRGYRKLAGKAPLTETLAAAMILNTPWKYDRPLVDPFCGSGTIPIEAAMIGANIAPGINREFISDSWDNIIPKKAWYNAVDEANDMIRNDVSMSICGYDIDDSMVKIARENAKLAQVDGFIHFQCKPVKELSSSKKYGFIITNPPYGERLEDKSAMPALYKEIGKTFMKLDTWSYYIISGYEDAQKYFGKQADKNRKIYNGMLKTYIYQYMGPKPPAPVKRTAEDTDQILQ